MIFARAGFQHGSAYRGSADNSAYKESVFLESIGGY